MLDCISVDTMRRSDAYTIANFVPSLELMYRAAYGVFLSCDWIAPVAVVVGSGNNGGDGFALACILQVHGIACTVFKLSDKLSGDSAFYAGKAESGGVTVKHFSDGCLDGFPCVVDCLLGTGFQGQLRDCYRNAIEEINNSSAYVVSVDINSGMNGDSGNCETAVFSDLTVTIGFIKKGLVTENAGKYMKRLVCADIGITLIQKEDYIIVADEEGQGIPCPGWLEPTVINAVLREKSHA